MVNVIDKKCVEVDVAKFPVLIMSPSEQTIRNELKKIIIKKLKNTI